MQHFDLVHVHGLFNFPYMHAGLMARKLGKSLVVSPHNCLDPYDLRKKRLLKSFLYGPLVVRPILNHARAIHCTADLEAKNLVTFGATRAAPRTVVPLPVTPPPDPPKATGAFRQTFNIPPGARVILFLGRIDRKKGLNLLLAAMPEIVRILPDTILAIAGEGDSDHLLELQAMARNLPRETIRWCGFLSAENKWDALHESTLFALPSYNENFGIAVVEALYARLPVLISDQVYLWPTLHAAGAAEICPPTLPAVTRALLSLLQDSTRLRDLAEKGSQMARATFTPEAVSGQLRQFYHSLVHP
jgi:glycosyltransferase involved in cell wall biosynthesis